MREGVSECGCACSCECVRVCGCVSLSLSRVTPTLSSARTQAQPDGVVGWRLAVENARHPVHRVVQRGFKLLLARSHVATHTHARARAQSRCRQIQMSPQGVSWFCEADSISSNDTSLHQSQGPHLFAQGEHALDAILCGKLAAALSNKRLTLCNEIAVVHGTAPDWAAHLSQRGRERGRKQSKAKKRKGNGREGKGREGKGREGEGREKATHAQTRKEEEQTRAREHQHRISGWHCKHRVTQRLGHAVPVTYVVDAVAIAAALANGEPVPRRVFLPTPKRRTTVCVCVCVCAQCLRPACAGGV